MALPLPAGMGAMGRGKRTLGVGSCRKAVEDLMKKSVAADDGDSVVVVDLQVAGDFESVQAVCEVMVTSSLHLRLP